MAEVAGTSEEQTKKEKKKRRKEDKAEKPLAAAAVPSLPLVADSVILTVAESLGFPGANLLSVVGYDVSSIKISNKRSYVWKTNFIATGGKAVL